jgi:hypothetical protein
MFDNEYHIKLGRSEYFAMRESRLPNPRVLFLQAFAITREETTLGYRGVWKRVNDNVGQLADGQPELRGFVEE